MVYVALQVLLCQDSHVEKIYLLLEDESFRKILECDLKLSDLILFSKQYYASIEDKKDLDSGLVRSGTELKNWLTKLESAKNKMTNLLNTSPLSKTKTTVFYLSSSYVNNIVNYLREEKIIAVIDMEMIDLRFHELKEYAKKYDNKDIDDFLEYMKDNDYISPISRQIVLLHHEKLNGSGYPFMMSGEQIPIHVRIVTLCDIFNAISSNRAYKRRMNADEALELIRAEAIYELDRDIYYHLLKVVNIYPVGTVVELSNGEVGIVIKENYEAQTRPVVQVIRQKKRAEIIDLMECLTLFISKTIEI